MKLLAAAREQTGLAIVTEVIASEDVPLVARYADVLQIGAPEHAKLSPPGSGRANGHGGLAETWSLGHHGRTTIGRRIHPRCRQ